MSTRDHILEFLIFLTKSATIRKLSGKPKKIYKYVLGIIFLNLINGDQLKQGQNQNIRQVCNILENPIEATRKYDLEQVKKQAQDFFASRHIKSPYDDATIDKVFLFFRKKLEDAKKGKTLFLASELEEIINLVPYYEEQDVPIKPHYWLDFSIMEGLIPTQPEFITYTDMINLWNLSMEQKNMIDQYHNKASRGGFGEQFDKTFELRSKMMTLLRNCVVSAITFAESYLYFLFYDFKQLRLFESNPKVKALYDKEGREHIQDTEIIKNLIFEVFPKFKTDNQINKLYKEYRKINNTRNGIIHTSVSKAKGVQQPKLQPVLNLSLPLVQEYLSTITDFIFTIDEGLPLEHQILFWRDRFEYPDFTMGETISFKNLEVSSSEK
ncbi:hypothetical protein Q8G31_28350 [Priestia megaterium]|uniref:hypothetical protein n=1 Tax=Priestia megaterium TaxID=1404 RepID=UPI0027305919|nr:hypothetical protein [Priestia megaterium]MDP1383614.1 hypothetical protein [Priestia megaterium]MDP1427765.1 hypothetical protein [Priestia megaterium]